MKYMWFAISLPLVLALVACTTAISEKYIYGEGGNNMGVAIEKTHWKEAIYKKGEYEFFPRFYTLARSYSKPHSIVVIYSSSQKKIHLKNIVMESSEGTYKDEIRFENPIALDKYNEERNSYYTSLRLFNEENTDLSKYWSEGDIKVSLSYIDSSGRSDKIVFGFKLWRGREIVFPT